LCRAESMRQVRALLSAAKNLLSCSMTARGQAILVLAIAPNAIVSPAMVAVPRMALQPPLLLQELSHRIRNSLQIIASMVSLEARDRKVGEGKAALERVSHRIAALGRLYSILGETNSVEEVDATTYLEALCRDLIESVQKENGTSIALKIDIESEPLPADRAIPLGLIVNELVTNAVKYAFPSKTRGRVAVTLKRIPGELRLTVSDDGKGFDPRRTDSGTGGRLVEIFARQLGGQVERKRGNEGTIVCLKLPSREASSDREASPRDKDGPRNVSD
jgi:two-component sensor histidine kinase